MTAYLLASLGPPAYLLLILQIRRHPLRRNP